MTYLGNHRCIEDDAEEVEIKSRPSCAALLSNSSHGRNFFKHHDSIGHAEDCSDLLLTGSTIISEGKKHHSGASST